MTIDDQDALGAVKDQLRGAEGVLRLILEHYDGGNIEAVRGAYELVAASLDKVRAILKAHERA